MMRALRWTVDNTARTLTAKLIMQAGKEGAETQAAETTETKIEIVETVTDLEVKFQKCMSPIIWLV